MKPSLRIPLTAIALASLATLAACNKPADKAAASKPAAEAGKPAEKTISGLPTEKDQVSYMVGMALGKQLAPIKEAC
jgi:hypothetical protein